MLVEETLYTSIHKPLLKKKLLIGSIAAVTGGLGITLVGAFGSVAFLDRWGLLTLLLGFLLIGWGLIPYRKLSHLSSKPNSLKINKDGAFYVDRNRTMFFIPFPSIESIRYIESKNSYGIGIDLKATLQKKLGILDPRFKPRSFLISSKRKAKSDIFLPFFPQSACKELEEMLGESK